MRIVAIIQARMGSTRLPGKILKQVMGKPLLEYQIERIKRSSHIDEIVIATTVKEADLPIVELCKQLNVACFRGSEEDVLARYYGAAVQYDADVVVRLTSDCPIIDPAVIDRVISFFLEHDVDYASNTLERTYPRGMDTEVLSFDVLKHAHLHAAGRAEREHVTPYIYMNKEQFRIGQLRYERNISQHRWTVDTSEDLELVSRIISSLYPVNPKFALKEIVALLEERPDWILLNAHVEQKKLEE